SLPSVLLYLCSALFSLSSFSLLLPRPPTSTLFPYTTLFRSGGFPVTVDMVSRFRTKQEQKETLANLAAGKLDIIEVGERLLLLLDRKSTRLNSSHVAISYAVFCLKKKKKKKKTTTCHVK